MINGNQGGRFNNGIIKQTPKEVKEFHTNDDVDSGNLAHHHTLGNGNFQAAPGALTKQALDYLTSGLNSTNDILADLIANFNAPVPHAIGYRQTVAGSFASGSYHNYGTADNQSLRGGITYSAATGNYTVPKDGVYAISGCVNWAANATSWRAIAIICGGITHFGITPIVSAAQVGFAELSFSKFLPAGSIIQVQIRQQSGVNLALDLTANGFMSIAWMGP